MSQMQAVLPSRAAVVTDGIFSLHVFRLSLSFSTLPLSLLLNVLNQSKRYWPWADWVARGDKRRQWSLTPRCFQFAGREIAFLLFWEHGNLLSHHGCRLSSPSFHSLRRIVLTCFHFHTLPLSCSLHLFPFLIPIDIFFVKVTRTVPSRKIQCVLYIYF